MVAGPPSDPCPAGRSEAPGDHAAQPFPGPASHTPRGARRRPDRGPGGGPRDPGLPWSARRAAGRAGPLAGERPSRSRGAPPRLGQGGRTVGCQVVQSAAWAGSPSGMPPTRTARRGSHPSRAGASHLTPAHDQRGAVRYGELTRAALVVPACDNRLTAPRLVHALVRWQRLWLQRSERRRVATWRVERCADQGHRLGLPRRRSGPGWIGERRGGKTPGIPGGRDPALGSARQREAYRPGGESAGPT